VLVAAAHITSTALWMLAAEYTTRGPRLRQASCVQDDRGEDLIGWACQRLRSWLAALDPPPAALRLALSPELAVLVHSFPLEESPQGAEQLATALAFELGQFLTDYDRRHYSTFALVLPPGNDAFRQVVAITYTRSELEQLQTVGAPGTRTELIIPDLFAVAPLWRYNYPERCGHSVVALHVAPPYLDILTLHGGNLVSLSTRSLPSETMPELLAACLQSITAARETGAVEEVVAFGTAVRREFLDALSAELAAATGGQLACRRLNAFRFWLPPEQERVRRYAIRTAHLFWACSAVCLPVEEEVSVL